MHELIQGLIALVAIGFVFLVVYLVVRLTREKKEPLSGDMPEEEGAHFYGDTQVLEKGTRSKPPSGLLSEDTTEYGVIFLLRTKERKFFEVPKEVFERLEEGQVGALVVREGRFSDFYEDIFQKQEEEKQGENKDENVTR